jgi:thymidylate synthase (FAD)
MFRPTLDPLLNCRVLSSTVEPQKLIWLAMHQCYSPDPALECRMSEEEAGDSVVRNLLKGGKGHWSPLEQAHMSVAIAYAPHDLVQQITRHRIMSFSVQSFRYSEINVESLKNIDSVVYLRQPGTYKDRTGKSYTYSPTSRHRDHRRAYEAVEAYLEDLEAGFAPEHARGLLPFNLRQHLVVGGNLRAWLHVLDLRLKADAQPEIQQLSSQIEDLLITWCPEIMTWYTNNRRGKALLSP